PNKAKGYYGATVAAPVFKTIAKQIFNNIPYEVQLSKEALKLLINPQKTQNVENILPDLAGLSRGEALKKIEKLGLQVKLKGSGIVKSQSPKAGTRIKKQQQIILELS
ncbi:MAG: PASTA domain-containing protein, partial [Flavobacteriaceae bacterium]